MATDFSDILLTEYPLRMPPVSPSPTAGAVIDFLGVVREQECGACITGIDYEACEEMALHQMNVIAQDALRRFSLERIVLHHRTGFVRASEPSLFLRVAAERRRPAFEASAWIIERLKDSVPIWKRTVPAQ